MMYLSANKDVGIPNNSIIAIKERTYYYTDSYCNFLKVDWAY